MINIIGAGLSGLSAAICLASHGQRVRLVSAQPSERAQSVLAEGGINASLDVMGENDAPQLHYQDTMKGGVYLADPNAVRGLTDAAPGIVTWLHTLGAPLQLEGGRLVQRAFGGQKKKRTAFAKSSTGKVLMTALIDEARRWEAQGLIERWSRHTCTRIMIQDGQCRGAVVTDRFTGEATLLPGGVILCCGGLNGFFPGATTGTTPNTGDLAASLFAQGVSMANLEFIQYHPTTIGIAGKRLLISEAARGEGGRLFIMRNGECWYFMEELYPDMGNLMPRDVVSREMTKALRRGDTAGPVCLDMTALSDDVWRSRLSDLREECVHYLSIDPAKAPIPVEPGIHFFMGGVQVNEAHRTNVAGLYAAGECACQYHGANRLGGNSMLAAIYGGQVAGQSALADGCASGEQIAPVAADRPSTDGFTLAVKDVLLPAMGIIRDEASLQSADHALVDLADSAPTPIDRDRVYLARAMVQCALSRTESRGAHWRSDYPDLDDSQRATTVARRQGSDIIITREPIPDLRP